MSGASNLGDQAATHRKKPMADLTAAHEWSSEFRDKLHGNSSAKRHHIEPKTNDKEVEKRKNDGGVKEKQNRKKNKENRKTTGKDDRTENASKGRSSRRDRSNCCEPDDRADEHPQAFD